MQNKSALTEGKNSDKLEAESALRGAACSRVFIHFDSRDDLLEMLCQRLFGAFPVYDNLPPDTGDDSLCNVRRLRAEIRHLNEQVKIMGDGLKTIAVSNWRTAGELRKMARDAFSAANADVDASSPLTPKDHAKR